MGKKSNKQRIKCLEEEVYALRAIVAQLSNDVIREEPTVFPDFDVEEPHSWSEEPSGADLDAELSRFEGMSTEELAAVLEKEL